MKHKRIATNKDILCFFLCLLYVKAEGGAVLSAAPSWAPTTLTPHPLDSSTKISPTLAIIFACLVLFFMAIVFLYIRRMNPNSFDEALGLHFLRHRPQLINTKGLDSTIIKTFPIFSYSDVKKTLNIGKSILECAVCLNEFEDEETLRLLPNCCHVFHPECIDAWLAFRTTCPVCRVSLEAKPGELKKPVHENSVPSHPATERSETVIDIHPNSSSPHETPKFMHLPPKSTPTRPMIPGMRLSRSHSKGHSLIQPGENCERFTLRLSDDNRKRLVDLTMS